MSRYHAASRIASTPREDWLYEDTDSVTQVAERLDWDLPAAEAIPLALAGATVYRGFGIGEGEDWREVFGYGGTPGGSSHSLMRSPALDFALGRGYLQGGAGGGRAVIVRTTVRPEDVNGGETAIRWSGYDDTPTKELAEMLYDGDTAYGEFEVVLRKLPPARYELEWAASEAE